MKEKRSAFAARMVAMVDTVTLLSCEEVAEIYAKAEAGEFDTELEAAWNNSSSI